MKKPINEALWQQLTQDVMTGMREWRAQHPKATLREMEQELDTRLNRMRARMLEDMALASAAADWTDTASGEQPTCPDCGQPRAAAGHRHADAPDAGRPGASPDTPVRHLPGLWRRAFSPSMRNSPCCPAA